ncbi:hypothetical protein [Actinocrispum sp. NPDC049592]|uniref:hypothetical protein n=1 Tax=Actinocrispum sp. NPDC049592 TaxID=3154835 RepID=UPI0034455E8C
MPTGVSKDDWNWQVFKAIQRLEGQAGRLTTFDKTLTIGAGFSSAGGAAQRILGRVCSVLPEVAQAAFEAGLAVDGKGAMSVADPNRKWILDGEDAAAYVQTSPELLSFIVDISQGTQPTGPGGPRDHGRHDLRHGRGCLGQVDLHPAVRPVPAEVIRSLPSRRPSWPTPPRRCAPPPSP